MLLVLPFISLLLMIATGPLFFPHFWHKYYKYICVFLGLAMGIYFLTGTNNHLVVETGVDYISFICMLSGLYIISGGVHIFADIPATPKINTIFLLFGAIIANIIGTTGASILLIRPFIRINRYRIRPFQIVFFIFIVSNAGGMLTPLGDPPLFFGYLKGVPFFWNITHLGIYWVVALAALLAIYYWLDKKACEQGQGDTDDVRVTNKIFVNGKRNFIALGIFLGSLFLDPRIHDWIPVLDYHGHKISFIRELVQILTALTFYYFANKKAYDANKFRFEPLLEVAFLFFGLFFTMVPAILQVEHLASQPEVARIMNETLLFFSTGTFSAFLDNAPTYINMLTAAMAKHNLDINNPLDVQSFINGVESCGDCNSLLVAISMSAVLFGAMTYIGNGPNFMVKAIAEDDDIKMPTFGNYITKYALVYLFPVLLLLWILQLILPF